MSDIVKEELKLPRGSENLYAFVLHNVFTPEECKELIKKTEKMGYEPALVNIGGGAQKRADHIRNSYRCIYDSKEDASNWWERIKDYVCTEWKGYGVLGLNERLRFLRYDSGQYFKPHYDGKYERDNGETSYITFQLYLNEGFTGGATTFISKYDRADRVECVPKTGSVLIFQHNILHEGSKLIEGRKYACRTDVMFDYKKKQPDS